MTDYSKMSDAELDALEKQLIQQSAKANSYSPTDGINYLLDKAGISPDSMTGKLVSKSLPFPLAAANLGSNISQNIAQTPFHPFNAVRSALNQDQTQIGTGLDAVASVGNFANQGNQELASLAKQNLGMPGKVLGTGYGMLSNALMPTDRMGAAMAPLNAIGGEGAANAAGNFAGQAALKTGAQGLKGFTGIMENYGKMLLEDPWKVLTAPSTEQAGNKIAQAAEQSGLKAGREGFKAILGSGRSPSPSQMLDYADQALVGGDFSAALMPQEALAHLQGINHVEMMPKYKNPLNASEMGYLNEYKQKLSGLLSDWGHGSVLDALNDYRFSVAKEQLMSAIPINQAGDASVLRLLTAAGLGGANEVRSRAKNKFGDSRGDSRGNSHGDPLGDAALMAAFSPAVMGPVAGIASLAAQTAAPVLSPFIKAGMMGLANKIEGSNQ